MNNLALTAIALSLALPSTSFAASRTPPRKTTVQQSGPIGVGAVVGSPTGVTAKYRLHPRGSIDAVIATAPARPFAPGGSALYLHSDYLFEGKPLVRAKTSTLAWFAGAGGRVSYGRSWKTESTPRGNGNGNGNGNGGGTESTRSTELGLGARVPVGLELRFDKVRPLEVFGETALDIGVVNSRPVGVEIGIGARWFF